MFDEMGLCTAEKEELFALCSDTGVKDTPVLLP